MVDGLGISRNVGISSVTVASKGSTIRAGTGLFTVTSWATSLSGKRKSSTTSTLKMV